jgi:hypothetical protein
MRLPPKVVQLEAGLSEALGALDARGLLERAAARVDAADLREVEAGLSRIVQQDELAWQFELSPPGPAIANVTMLFSGSEDDGILSSVAYVVLTLNGRVVDVAIQAPGDDPRVVQFPAFPTSAPFPCFALGARDTLEIVVVFAAKHAHPLDQLRILADVVPLRVPTCLRDGDWDMALPRRGNDTRFERHDGSLIAAGCVTWDAHFMKAPRVYASPDLSELSAAVEAALDQETQAQVAVGHVAEYDVRKLLGITAGAFDKLDDLINWRTQRALLLARLQVIESRE